MSTSNSWQVERVGHRITGGPSSRRSSRGGRLREGTCRRSDDATRLAYVEVLADEQEGNKTVASWPGRRNGFSEQGITCRRILRRTTAPPIDSDDWRKSLCRALDLKPIRTKPYTPQTNGKGRTVHQKPSCPNGPM